ncbi:MAG: long-chain fatty acid--CoA ligase [Archangium gephyra]|uniref:Long-chain fatty acid--CoA ligase n=1 Tax=Archangium gephyra TaxID=48 RepID=A0A2W5THU3_9BACT|nr:MAG: long-chain fatty acid--CoA ligase [Archangium gephyra]
MSNNVTAFLDGWAEKTPDKIALISGAQQTSFAQLRERVSRLAGALQQRGGRVFVLDKNVGSTIELMLAAGWGGTTCIIGNWRLAPAELEWIINDAQATTVVVGAEFAASIEALRSKLPLVTHVVTSDDFEALITSSGPVARANVAPDDCFLQLYTSGTTGFPKGAMLTHRGMSEHSANMAKVFDVSEKSVNLVPMPLFHVGGSSWAMLSLFCGGTSIITRDPTPASLLQQIAQHRVTHTFVVPAILQGLVAVPRVKDLDTSSLQTVLYGASPISVPLLEKVLATFSCRFAQVYGMTELSGVFCVLDDAAHRDPQRLASAGKPSPGVELRCVEPASGRELPRGQLGEFQVRSAQMMKGYWGQPEATAQLLTRDGWLKTGDAGHVDDDGFVFITDRIKDMVITGGENVYPSEIERVLQRHPAIADVAVFGIPHEKWGETLRAEVVLKPSQQVSEAELIAWFQPQLATYKRPTQVGFIAALPRNASGKVLKRELRAPFWQGRARSLV